MQIYNNITYSNISVLSEGLKLLTSLNEDQFRAESKPAFQASIGAHFRHVIEHYQCFFDQVEQQHFCYDLRQRNLQLETDLLFAKQSISDLIFFFRHLDLSTMTDTFTISDDSMMGKVDTSLARELVFLQSHATHHYAIIAAISRTLGIVIENDFGVAIATRNHQMMNDNMRSIACAP